MAYGFSLSRNECPGVRSPCNLYSPTGYLSCKLGLQQTLRPYRQVHRSDQGVRFLHVLPAPQECCLPRELGNLGLTSKGRLEWKALVSSAISLSFKNLQGLQEFNPVEFLVTVKIGLNGFSSEIGQPRPLTLVADWSRSRWSSTSLPEFTIYLVLELFFEFWVEDVPNGTALPDVSSTEPPPGPSGPPNIPVHYNGVDYELVVRQQLAPKCVFCPRRIADRVEMENHTKEHFVEADFALTCQICGQKCQSAADLKEHLNVHRLFICPVCSQEFVDIMELNVHGIAKHNVQLPIPCNHCPKAFGTVNLLKLHMFLHGEKARKDIDVKCIICKDLEGYRTIKNAIKHMKECQGDYRIVCSLCSTVFGTEYELDVHLVEYHTTVRQNCLNRMRTCTLCGKLFASQACMMDHLREEIKSILNSAEPESVAKAAETVAPKGVSGQQDTFEDWMNLKPRRKPRRPTPSIRTTEVEVEATPVANPEGSLEILKSIEIVVQKATSEEQETSEDRPRPSTSISATEDEVEIPETIKIEDTIEVSDEEHTEQLNVQKEGSKEDSNEDFNCVLCAETCESRWDLEQHMKQQHDEKELEESVPAETRVFHCHLCTKRDFAVRSHLLTHLRLIHGEASVKEALTMEEAAKDATSLESSNLNDLEVNGKELLVLETLVECPICWCAFEKVNRLTWHMKVHSYEPTLCLLCSKEFSGNSELIEHMNIHKEARKMSSEDDDNDVRLRKCYLCSKLLVTRELLRVHMSMEHTLRYRYQCAHCLQRMSRDRLESHMTKHFNVWDPLKCRDCGKVFTKQSCLNFHVNRALKKGVCRVCNKKFCLTIAKRHHEREVHNIVYDKPDKNLHKCPICRKKFRLKSLKHHLNVHRDVASKQCKYCPRIYRTDSSLAEHVKLSHTGWKTCHICKRVFQGSYGFKEHMKVHDRKCYICSELVATKESLRSHLKEMHNITMPGYTGQEEQADTKECFRTIGERYKCSFCKAQFRKETTRKRHVEMFHNTKFTVTGRSHVKPFQCYHCKVQFRYLGELSKHMKVHEEDKHNSEEAKDQLQLEENRKHLPKTKFEKLHLLEVSTTVHNGENKNSAEKQLRSEEMNLPEGPSDEDNDHIPMFECEKCFWTFEHISDLEEHMNIHIFKKRKTTKKMAKKSNTSDARTLAEEFNQFNEEVVAQGTDSFKCGNCKMVFTTEDDLRVHFLEHTGGQSYQCAQCCKIFQSKDILEWHMMSHNSNGIADPAPQEQVTDRRMVDSFHTCEYCLAIFIEEHQLLRHLEFCHGGTYGFRKFRKVLKCLHCGKNYKYKSSLLRHLLIFHDTSNHDFVEITKSDKPSVGPSIDSDVEILEDYPEIKIEETEIMDDTYEYEEMSIGMDIEPEILDCEVRLTKYNSIAELFNLLQRDEDNALN
ncbi:hypothetical protein DMENIID0001_006300 [Sergentomyia squamirostris]